MPFISSFQFKFSEEDRDEGVRLARAIGQDMTKLDGYEHHEVIQDVTDPGHLMVNTRWASREQGASVLEAYQRDKKVKRAGALIPKGPQGFIGIILD